MAEKGRRAGGGGACHSLRELRASTAPIEEEGATSLRLVNSRGESAACRGAFVSRPTRITRIPINLSAAARPPSIEECVL